MGTNKKNPSINRTSTKLKMDQQSLVVSSSCLPSKRAADTFRSRRTGRCEAMKRPRSLHSQLAEKVIRHQAERAAVSANKRQRPQSTGQKGGSVGASNQEVTAGCEDLSCRWTQTGQLPTLTFKWQQRLAAALIVHTFFCMYMWKESCQSVCVCVYTCAPRPNLKVRWNYIQTHRLSVCLWFPWVAVRRMNMEECRRHGDSGQGDTSGQVCACDCPPVCQRFVPGQQVASQRTSVTFSLSFPPPLLPTHPQAPTSPQVPILVTTVSTQQVPLTLHKRERSCKTQMWVVYLWTHEPLFWQSIAE